MKKQLLGLFSLFLLTTGMIAFNYKYPQEPLMLEDGMTLSDIVRVIPCHEVSFVMLSKEEQNARAFEASEIVRKQKKRQQANKLLLALLVPIGFKFGVMIPVAQALGFSMSWTAAAASIPLEMGRTSIKMAMQKHNKKRKAEQHSPGFFLSHIPSLL